MRKNNYKEQFSKVEAELISKFGRKRLEETAFPVYFNKFPLAAYLGWSRIFTAQKLLAGKHGNTALDFGGGLGVSLPYLAEHYNQVIACDIDPEITKFVVQRLGLDRVRIVSNILECKPNCSFNTILALDVLEHVENLRDTYESFKSVTTQDGVWIISGPTENFLYKFARKIARTTGEGHVRNIYDVFNEVPEDMVCEKIYTLPWGIPLFLVGKFRKIK